MQERLQRVPLFMYMFAISLVVVALADLNAFTTILAGIFLLMCVMRICEAPASKRNAGITTIEEPPYPARRTEPRAMPRRTVPRPRTELATATVATTTPAIRLTERIAEQTNGRGFRMPDHGETFVLEVDDDSAAETPAPASRPSKEQSAAAIARFFQRGETVTRVAPSAPEEPVTPQEKVVSGESDLMYLATHAAYLDQHPAAIDALPPETSTTCRPLSETEQQHWQKIIAACEAERAQADQTLQDWSAELGHTTAPRPLAASFAKYTRQMLTMLSADERDLERTLTGISTTAQRMLHEVDLATSEVMMRDAYDYMPSPFPGIPRVREGCPALPSSVAPHQLSAGYRASGHHPGDSNPQAS